jgi:hypothetical protein
MKFKFVCLWLLFFFGLALPAYSATYEVGPGKRYASIGSVPWESMGAGDTVLIYWRQTPYKEKWVIAVQATKQQPFIVQGVANEQGVLPVIDGRGATTRSAINFWNEDRGVIKIGGANRPAVDTPSYIVLENLDIRSGRTPYQFTGRDGLTNYQDDAASVYVETGRNIEIRNCFLHDSGNGLFVSSATRNITIEECWIYDNGIENSIYEHNTYTEAIGITYQFNHFGPLRANCGGNNLKDRSAGLIVRYNWIEGGNRALDLVDAEDSSEIVNDPGYHKTFVYGNVLIKPPSQENNQVLHYGGDSGDESIYRKGTLYFYNNTVVSTRPDNTTLLMLSTNDETCDCRNNIIWTSAGAGYLALVDQSGIVHLTHNWMKTGWVASHSGLTGVIHDDGGNITGAGPGFINASAQDFNLDPHSRCVNAGTVLSPNAYPVLFQYVKHLGYEARPAGSGLDLGAFGIKRGTKGGKS